jgi:hypothetical protein
LTSWLQLRWRIFLNKRNQKWRGLKHKFRGVLNFTEIANVEAKLRFKWNIGILSLKLFNEAFSILLVHVPELRILIFSTLPDLMI